jgi:hypothetical protein
VLVLFKPVLKSFIDLLKVYKAFFVFYDEFWKKTKSEKVLWIYSFFIRYILIKKNFIRNQLYQKYHVLGIVETTASKVSLS